MRSYIFTQKERKVIRSFLDGKVVLNDPALEVIRSRMKTFTELASDIALYAALRKAVSARST